MSIATLWQEFTTWWEGTTIGQEIDSAAEAAKSELESIGEQDMANIAESTATGILTGLATGGTAAAIAGGITAAETAFKASEVQVSSATLGTFVATLHSSIAAQQAAGAVTPAAPTPTAPAAA
jgi:hypothetical protein